MFKPGFERLCGVTHAYGVKVFMHSCGKITAIIPDLIEAGVDVLDPVQVKAEGMVPRELKAEFGDRICFSGGVDEQQLLIEATPDEVRSQVRRLLDDMARDGGFFIGPTHNFQADIPLENILAMYEAAANWS